MEIITNKKNLINILKKKIEYFILKVKVYIDSYDI